MRYPVFEVAMSTQPSPGRRFHRTCGTLICALLVFFAVGAKLAGYYRSQGAENFASVKILPAKASIDVDKTVQTQQPQTSATALPLFSQLLLEPSTEPARYRQPESAPAPDRTPPVPLTAVRPPPAC